LACSSQETLVDVCIVKQGRTCEVVRVREERGRILSFRLRLSRYGAEIEVKLNLLARFLGFGRVFTSELLLENILNLVVEVGFKEFREGIWPQVLVVVDYRVDTFMRWEVVQPDRLLDNV